MLCACLLTAAVLAGDSVIGWHDPAVAPDGSRIAAALLGKIWIVPITGGKAEPLTSGSGWDHHPAWSPDGRFVAFAHQRPGAAELVVRSLETGQERTVYQTEDGRVIGQIAWRGADGDLVFVLETHQFMAHLWSVGLRADSKAKPLTQGNDQAEWSFAVSPDGKEAVVEWVQRGPTDLFRVALDSTAKSSRLTETPGEEFSPQWTKDNRLVYVVRDNGVDRVMVRDLASGAARSVFESPFDGKQLALVPGGRSVVMVAGRKLHRLDLTSGALTDIPVEVDPPRPAMAAGDLVIANVRLWDGTGAPVRSNAWVAIKRGRIAEVGTGAAPSVAGAAVIDGEGKFLLPGMIDNHFHYWHQWIFDGARRLAQGITSGRDPGTELAEALNLKDAVRRGVLPGPDMYTTGPIIDGPCGIHPMVDVIMDRAEAGPALVRTLKAAGVDAIKVYHCLAPDVLEAIVAEARRQGLPVTGDLGNRTHWDRAIAAGITGLNHAYTYRGTYLPSEYRIFRDDDLPQMWNARFRLQGNIPVDPERPEVDSVLATMARRGVALDPTVNVFEVSDSARKALGVDEGARADLRWRQMQRFVKKAVDAGVMLLAGTDASSLNQELEDYETIGIARSTILQSATINGAKWLGKEADFGAILPGRKGHLVLVDGDPLAAIKDLRKVELVVKDGRVVFRRQ